MLSDEFLNQLAGNIIAFAVMLAFLIYFIRPMLDAQKRREENVGATDQAQLNLMTMQMNSISQMAMAMANNLKENTIAAQETVVQLRNLHREQLSTTRILSEDFQPDIVRRFEGTNTLITSRTNQIIDGQAAIKNDFIPTLTQIQTYLSDAKTNLETVNGKVDTILQLVQSFNEKAESVGKPIDLSAGEASVVSAVIVETAAVQVAVENGNGSEKTAETSS